MPVARRSVLKSFAVLPLAALLQETVEVVLHNARIYTGNERQPEAQALAVSGGRIVAVGANHEVLGLASHLTRKVDLGGRRVLPGFIDAHAHPALSGLEHLTKVACDKSSIEEILAALRARAADTQPGEWLQGFLYDDGKTPRPLSRHDLDQAIPEHPVLVQHRGGHTAFVNTLALTLAGVDSTTPDPAGGRYGRDQQGQLTGFVADAAMNRMQELLPNTYSAEQRRDGAALISRMFVSRGITSACDADATHADLKAYQDAHDAGELRMRSYCLIAAPDLPNLIASGLHTGFGDRWLKIGGVKLFADGSISERTAWLSTPYLDMPGAYTGLALSTREALYESARTAWLAGFQVATHANGDLAIDRTLGVYEQLMTEAPRRDARPRLEHCTLVNEALIQRMKAVGAVPVPFGGYVYFHGDVLHFYGAARTEHMFAMRSLIDAGLKAASSSDYTASPADPLLWMQSQVTRTDPAGHVWGANQSISVAEAITCATQNGAYSQFAEHEKGTLQPGKLADLVVLQQDPFAVSPQELARIRVERTMLEGRWVYES